MRATVLASVVLIALVGFATTHAAQPTLDTRVEAAIQLYREEGAEKALPEFEALSKEFVGPHRMSDRAAVLHYTGECHWRLGHFDVAKPHLEHALQLERAAHDRLAEGKTLNTLGLLEWDQGQYKPAMTLFRRAGAIAREIGDRKLEGSSLNNLSLVHDELGDYDTSLQQYQRVLELYKDADFPRGVGDTLGNIGGVHLILGQFKEALGYYQQALAISQQLKSKAAMSQDHGNIALCLLGLGDVDTALSHLDRSIELAQQTGMQQDQAYWKREKGNALLQKGSYDQALASHRAALAIYEKLGAQAELLETLHDSGRLHLLLGDHASAEQDFRRALALAQSIGFARGITQNLLAIGEVQGRRQLWDNATSYYDQARKRAADAGQQNLLARSLLALADVHRRHQHPGLADDAAGQALAIARRIGSRQLEARAQLVHGQLAFDRGHHEEALQALGASKRAIAPVGDPDLLWQIEFGRARALDAQGETQTAVAALQSAVQVIESTRGRLQEPRFRAGYVEDKFEVYRELMRLQLKQGRTSDAFSTAERLRARAYVEQLGGRYSYALSNADRQKEASLRARIRQLQDQFAAEDEEGNPAHPSRARHKFSEELARAEREYGTFLDDRAQAPTGNRPEPPMISAKAVQGRLPADTALLEYVVGPSSIVAFVVSSSGVTAHTLPIEQTALAARISLLRDLVRRPDTSQWVKPAHRLYVQLIEPLEAEGSLRGVRRLYLVPHGPLNYLSFAMLPSASQATKPLLVDKYTIAYLPAAAALLHQASNRTDRSLMALAPARSRLKYASDEARSVDALYRPKSRLLLGTDATESRFKTDAGGYQYLHLATHGNFDRINPLLSGLELEGDESNDGLLQVHEVLGLRLRSSLVTLSACETALGGGYFTDLPNGDEFIGMSRAFLAAGSVAVMAALWPVDDQASVTVMKRFYSELDKAGPQESSALALAEAQRGLRGTGSLQHPFYWAAYVVVGPMNRDLNERTLTSGRT